MKRNLLLTVLLVIAVSSAAMAQSSSFNKGDNLFNAGIGLGSPFFGAGYSSTIPVNPTVSFEKGITDAISVGGIFSYASSKYKYSVLGSDYSFKESAIFIGARGSYHFNSLLELNPNIDLYGGASLGYVIVSVSNNQGYTGSAASAAGFGLFGGIRYYFQPKIAVYGELGYESLSVLNVGVTFKF